MPICNICGQDKRPFEMDHYENRNIIVSGDTVTFRIGICEDCRGKLSNSDIDDIFEKMAKEYSDNKKLSEENEKRERELEEEYKQAEASAANMGKEEFARSHGFNGYWEYKTVSLLDSNWSGRIDIESLQKCLNIHGLVGWHLKTAITNEVGKNALGSLFNGIGLSVNSTVDETILIFERWVEIK